MSNKKLLVSVVDKVALRELFADRKVFEVNDFFVVDTVLVEQFELSVRL